MKLWTNRYGDKRDLSTLWILLGVLAFLLLTATVALWLLHSALR